MEAACSSETLVTTCHTTRCNNPEDRNLNLGTTKIREFLHQVSDYQLCKEGFPSPIFLNTEVVPFISGEQAPLGERKGTVAHWMRKVVRTRRCLAIFATLGTCAVVLLVTLLVLLPRHDKATGTSVRLPEDGNISPKFTYQGNCTDIILILITFSHALYKPFRICTKNDNHKHLSY
jgi:hypothetical protein